MTELKVPTARVDAQDVVTEILWSRLYDRDQGAVVKARHMAAYVVAALKREGLITGSRVADADEVINSTLEKAAKFSNGEAPRRGVSHLVAEALVLLNLPVVHRDVLVLLMPRVDGRLTTSTVGMQFGRALRKFHNWKWINRGEDGLIAVLDRAALVQWFAIAEDLDDDRAAITLDIVGAVRAMKAADNTDELRRQELQAVERLMRTVLGATTNERGQVRLLAKPDMV